MERVGDFVRCTVALRELHGRLSRLQESRRAANVLDTAACIQTCYGQHFLQCMSEKPLWVVCLSSANRNPKREISSPQPSLLT